jgi:hypothetical protein
MASKYMKCSNFLVMEVLQVKTTLGFHLIPVRMARIKSNNNNKCWQGCDETRTLTHHLWECKLAQTLWKAIWRFPKKLETRLPYDSEIPLLGIYPKECKTGYNRDTGTLKITAALFTIVKLWKQLR